MTVINYFFYFKHVPIAKEKAKIFLKEIYRLYRFPISITTDIGMQIISKVWKNLMKILWGRFEISNYIC